MGSFFGILCLGRARAGLQQGDKAFNDGGCVKNIHVSREREGGEREKILDVEERAWPAPTPFPMLA
eukprot:scaffold74470_cov21-Tisochrysis_lutea.AAC.1